MDRSTSEARQTHHFSSIYSFRTSTTTMRIPRYHLPSLLLASPASAFFVVRSSARYGQVRLLASVTGTAYTSEVVDAPTVKLFTKEGCTLCDKVKDVLMELRDEHPHSLYQVDITDENHAEYFSKYKYDIPVLHMGDAYWTKHRITIEEAVINLSQARQGTFTERPGEPDAGEMERHQAERQTQ
jgi:thiol-disulfide isomerase/thioredoxin